MMNRLMMMKQHHHAPNMLPGMPQFPNAGQPRQMPQPGKATVPIANVSPLKLGNSVAASVPAKSDAASSDNPYQSIVTRNVFGLNPIPPSAPITQQPGPPPPRITLTGITTIFGPAEALFRVAGVVRAGKPPHDESYIFTEGEEEDEVEVTKIDTQKNIVTFVNHGVQQELSLSDAAATGPAPAPTYPGQNNNFGGGRFGARRLPPALQQQMEQRMRSFGGGNGFNPSANGGMSPSGYSGNYNNNNAAASPAVNLSADDQAALIAAERAAAANQGNSILPNILPPTPQYDDKAKDALR